jgi:hypothetical protein
VLTAQENRRPPLRNLLARLLMPCYEMLPCGPLRTDTQRTAAPLLMLSLTRLARGGARKLAGIRRLAPPTAAAAAQAGGHAIGRR